VPASATAVVATVTAAGSTTSSFLTVYPAGVTMPTASNLNFGVQGKGVAIANRVTVGIGTGGAIEVYNHTGSVNVDVDVDGYYGPSGSYFVPITPVRLTDTRVPTNGNPITANASEIFDLFNSVIPQSATAVAANYTVVAGAANGFLSVYPTSDSTAPVASDVNWVAKEIVPNFTIADTASTGFAEAYNGPATGGATINLVIDAFGYFTSSVPAIAVSANPASIGIGSTPSVITATVALNSSITYQDPVLFTATGTGTCGTFSGASYTHTSSTLETVTANYNVGSATVGSCQITVTEAEGGQSATTTVSTTAAPNAISFTAPSFSGTPAVSKFAAGTGAFPVTVLVLSSASADVSGDTVHFTESGAPTAACGALSSSSGTTAASGALTVLYTPSATPGFCDITAAEAGTGASITGTLEQTNATALLGVTTSVATSPTIITSSGTSTSTITVTTASGTGVYGSDPVEVSVGTGCGTLAGADANGHTFVVTGATTGTATVTYTGTTTSGVCQITGTEANEGTTGATGSQSLPGNDSNLTTGLTKGAAVTTLAVSALAAAVPAGATVDVFQGTASQQFVSVPGAAKGETSITVTSAAANFSYTTAAVVVTDGSSVIEQTAVATAADTIVLAPAGTTVLGASGAVVFSVTVTLDGAAVTPDTGLTLTGVPSVSGACPDALLTAGLALATNSSGVAQYGYNTTGTVGFCSLTATDPSGGTSNTAVVDQTT